MTAPRLLVLLALVAIAPLAGCLSGPETGGAAPPFEVRALDGATLDLGDYRGKVLLLDFMASWCGPCQEEAPAFRAIKDRHGPAGLEVLMVSVDLSPGEPDALRQFGERFGLNVTFAQDHTNQAKVAYGATRLPTLAIIDRDGRLTEVHEGTVVDEAFLEARVTPLLAQAAGAAPVEASAAPAAGWLLLLFAFNAGVLTFFSPCGFPMLPAYVAYYLNLEERERGFRAANLVRGLAGGAVAGLGALVVIALAAALAISAGALFTDHVLLLELLGGLFMVGMGAAYLLDRGPTLTVPARPSANRGYLPLFGFGALYAAVAAGCVAPLFVGTVVSAASVGSPGGAALVFAAYAAGIVGLLLLLSVVLATTRGLLVDRLKRFLPHVKRLGGITMVLVGLYLVAYWLSLKGLLPFG